MNVHVYVHVHIHVHVLAHRSIVSIILLGLKIPMVIGFLVKMSTTLIVGHNATKFRMLH